MSETENHQICISYYITGTTLTGVYRLLVHEYPLHYRGYHFATSFILPSSLLALTTHVNFRMPTLNSTVITYSMERPLDLSDKMKEGEKMPSTNTVFYKVLLGILPDFDKSHLRKVLLSPF